jgi:hypothetical protein
MADRMRVNLTLTPRQLEDLHWLAGERTMLPAALARDLVVAGMAAALADPAARARYERDRSQAGATDGLVPDIVRAMSVPGVPAVLAGELAGAGDEPHRVASWLVHVSRWLADERPESQKGPAPALDGWLGVSVSMAAVGPALALANGGAARAAAARPAAGVKKVSDKRQLSDTGPAIAAHEVTHGQQ